ncbi:MAG: hypothetical protein BWY59_00182 [Verrucomicrobia bacterium ADurb.Bin345]|nr:MAG: hypothetical protein BWY59_00182 [Verrucomicrobia bacterium ADurb.Bin345]
MNVLFVLDIHPDIVRKTLGNKLPRVLVHLLKRPGETPDADFVEQQVADERAVGRNRQRKRVGRGVHPLAGVLPAGHRQRGLEHPVQVQRQRTALAVPHAREMHPLVRRQGLVRNPGVKRPELRPQDGDVVGQLQAVHQLRLGPQPRLVAEEMPRKAGVEQLHIALDRPVTPRQILANTRRHRAAARFRLRIRNDDTRRIIDHGRPPDERIGRMHGTGPAEVDLEEITESVVVGIRSGIHAEAGGRQRAAECFNAADAETRARTDQGRIRRVRRIPSPFVG